MSATPIQIVKNAASKFTQFVKLPQQAHLWIASSFLRGAVWAMSFITVLFAIAASVLAASNVADPIGSAYEIALLVFQGSQGLTVHLSTLPDVVYSGTGQWMFVNLHPALIPMIFLISSFASGKKFARTIGSQAKVFSFITFAVARAAGFTVITWLTALTVQELHLADYSISSLLRPISSVQQLWFFVVIAIVALLGATGDRVSLGTGAGATLSWIKRSVLGFIKLYGALIVVAALVAGIAKLIDPVFQISSPETAPAQPAAVAWQLVVAVCAGILLMLPNLLISIFLVATGVQTESQVNPMLNVDWLNQANQNVAKSFGLLPYLIVLAVVLLVAIFASSSAAHKARFKPTNALSQLTMWSFVAGSLVVTAWYLNINFGLEHKRGVNFFESQASYLSSFAVSNSTLFLLFILLTVGFTIGATRGFEFAVRSLPRLHMMLNGQRLASESVDFFERLLGVIVVAAFTLVCLFPIGVATVNRVWAATDGPSQAAGAIAGNLASGNKELITTTLTANGSPSGTKWLPDSALSITDLAKATNTSIEVVNSNKRAWQVGDLDASATIIWTLSDGTQVKAPVGIKMEVRSELNVLTHPHIFTSVEPVQLSLQLSDFLKNAKQTTVNVNGTKVEPGQYLAFPGIYHIEAPGFDLVAPTSLDFATDGNISQFIAGNDVLLPSGADAMLNAKFNTLKQACASLNKNNSNSCFNAARSASDNGTVDGVEPDTYFDSNVSGYKITKTTCSDKSTDTLTSSKEMQRAYSCTAHVTYSETFYDSRTVSVPQYESRPKLVYDFWSGYSWVWERVQVGTTEQEVRGSAISTLTGSVDVDYNINVAGYLDAAKKFQVRK